jgi:predicted amidophosphoribosyltransferase
MSASSICLGCRKNPRKSTHYLCSSCWSELPLETQCRLTLRDHDARHRLFQLFSAIRRGVALGEIYVTQ